MSKSRIMKLITAILEGILALPILGGAIVVATSYWALIVMLVLHVITLILTRKDNGFSAGSILGIITSLIAWIPVIGWLMHLVTAIFLVIGTIKKDGPKEV